MIDFDQIGEFVASKIPGATVHEVERAMEHVDIERICEVQDERYSWELWDGETPINGCDRDELISLGMPLPASSEAFLVRDSRTSRVVYFQPFDPDVPNFQPMNVERASSLAETTKNRFAHQTSLSAIVKAVKLEIDHDKQRA